MLGNRELSRQAGERSALIRSPFALAKQQGTGISRKVKKELDAACITPALDPEKGRGDVLSESGLGMAPKIKTCLLYNFNYNNLDYNNAR